MTIDETAKTVTVTIPHVTEELDIDEEKTAADETEKIGIFAVGDPELSEDARKELILKVKDEMRTKLTENQASQRADEMAEMVVTQIYQPIVSMVATGYLVKVQFETT